MLDAHKDQTDATLTDSGRLERDRMGGLTQSVDADPEMTDLLLQMEAVTGPIADLLNQKETPVAELLMSA